MQNLSSTNLNYLNNILQKQASNAKTQQEQAKPQEEKKDKVELSSVKKLASNKPLLLVAALSVVSSLISIFAIHKASNSQKTIQEGQKALINSFEELRDKVSAQPQAPTPSSIKINASALTDTITKAVEEAFSKFSSSISSSTSSISLNEKQMQEIKQLLEAKNDELSSEIGKSFSDLSKTQNALLKAQIAQTLSQALSQAISQIPNKEGAEKIDTVALANEILQHINSKNITQEIQKSLQSMTEQSIEAIKQGANEAIRTSSEKIQTQGEEVLAAVGDRVLYGINKVNGETAGKIDEISKSASEAIEEITNSANKSAQEAIGKLETSAQGISLGLEQSAKGYVEKTNQTLDSALQKAKELEPSLETTISQAQDKVEATQARRLNTSKLSPLKDRVTLADIRFDKGKAYLKSGEAFSGYLEDQTKEGKRFMISFKDGEMLTSNAQGLQKIYNTETKNGHVTKRIITSREGGVDNVFIYRKPQDEGENFHMCARKFAIDGKNKLKREIMRFNLKEDGHYEKMQAKDGPYLKAVSTSGYSKEFSQELQEYNKAMLQENKFGEHIDTQIEGFTAFYPGNVEGFVVEGKVEKDETGKLRNIFLHSKPKGISSLAREKDKGLQVVKFDVQ